MRAVPTRWRNDCGAEPERDCVVLDQSQHVWVRELLRLVFDTAAPRSRHAIAIAPLESRECIRGTDLCFHILRTNQERCMDTEPLTRTSKPHLHRRFSLLPATALNMSNMVGIGPFITIPLLMTALNGPQSMLGWIVGAVLAIADGMVWAELGAALPGSGGTYQYLRFAYGRETWGRLMAFLFIWQFILSGPMEIASGYIGFAKYLGYVWRGMTATQTQLVCVALGIVTMALLYRRIQHVARLTIMLWVGTILTTAIVIVAGAFHFDAKVAFDFPPVFNFSIGFLFGLGAATRVGIYDYLGYYDICYIGDEVKDPGRTIPRSILISVVGVAAIYFAMNLSISGVVSWRDFVPMKDENPVSQYVVSIFMEKLFGRNVATGFTLLILWTTLASVFALMLGYSRIPYAAARDGAFFRLFAKLHSRHDFPHVSLLVVGGLSIVFSFLSLGMVIDVLITSRIVVQFIGQIGAVALLRRNHPEVTRPYKMWLYPLPSLVALAGWIFIFATTDERILVFANATLFAGIGGFLAWAKTTRRWPFAPATET
jgi:amino acid transporter